MFSLGVISRSWISKTWHKISCIHICVLLNLLSLVRVGCDIRLRPVVGETVPDSTRDPSKISKSKVFQNWRFGSCNRSSCCRSFDYRRASFEYCSVWHHIHLKRSQMWLMNENIGWRILTFHPICYEDSLSVFAVNGGGNFLTQVIFYFSTS